MLLSGALKDVDPSVSEAEKQCPPTTARRKTETRVCQINLLFPGACECSKSWPESGWGQGRLLIFLSCGSKEVTSGNEVETSGP